MRTGKLYFALKYTGFSLLIVLSTVNRSEEKRPKGLFIYTTKYQYPNSQLTKSFYLNVPKLGIYQ
jgi:hypothetical protein